MKHFGIPYQGSKDKIALDIHKRLPAGKRFVDLFGGGFAMSHSALLIKGKYDAVLYNDYEPLLCELIKDAIAGKYNYKVFKPDFISRQDFARLKDRDGYVKYIWSFGNAGNAYLYGKDVEPIKRVWHNYCIFGEPIEGIPVKGDNPKARRLNLKKYSKAGSRVIQLERLERLQQLERIDQQQLESLERLQQLESLEITCGSYIDYEYKEGDIVYCDPPYEDTIGYNKATFNHKAFYDWVATRPYQVWFSSYKISDDRFKLIFAKRIRGTAGGAIGAKYNFECLYTNK